jgi:hypothetical protein
MEFPPAWGLSFLPDAESTMFLQPCTEFARSTSSTFVDGSETTSRTGHIFWPPSASRLTHPDPAFAIGCGLRVNARISRRFHFASAFFGYFQMSVTYIILRDVKLTFACRTGGTAVNGRAKKIQMNFKTMAQLDIPQGRNGKHKTVITKILSDLDQLPAGRSKCLWQDWRRARRRYVPRSIAPYTGPTECCNL